MNEPDVLTRITSRPDVFGGKPIIRDMRISVELEGDWPRLSRFFYRLNAFSDLIHIDQFRFHRKASKALAIRAEFQLTVRYLRALS